MIFVSLPYQPRKRGIRGIALAKWPARTLSCNAATLRGLRLVQNATLVLVFTCCICRTCRRDCHLLRGEVVNVELANMTKRPLHEEHDDALGRTPPNMCHFWVLRKTRLSLGSPTVKAANIPVIWGKTCWLPSCISMSRDIIWSALKKRKTRKMQDAWAGWITPSCFTLCWFVLNIRSCFLYSKPALKQASRTNIAAKPAGQTVAYLPAIQWTAWTACSG